MSGYKYTRYWIEREREEKLRVISSINALQKELKALQRSVNEYLERVPEGLKSTFYTEAQAAQKWLDEVKGCSAGLSPSLSQALDELRRVEARQKSLLARGRELRKRLVLVFTEQADELHKQLLCAYDEVEQLLRGNEELLSTWVKPFFRQAVENVATARDLLHEKRLKDAERLLAKTQAEIQKAVESAKKQEELHQKRLYLLGSLRQVCKDLGFEEISKPKLEREDDPTSSILYVVETFAWGQIRFSITLDSVQAFSQLNSATCFEKFDLLSQSLKDGFGINTEFRHMDGSRPPKLVRKEEKPLPRSRRLEDQA